MKLLDQIQILTRPYARKGGKENRRQQIRRMEAFGAYCAALGAVDMGQVGGRHVVGYWKALRASGGLAPKTLNSHRLAIAILWELSGKIGEPPRPFPSEKVERLARAQKQAFEERG
jgi:hypothetical protein